MDNLQIENYERHSILGLILSVIVILGVGFIWINEASRMDSTESEYIFESELRGNILYLENCTSCHGPRGEGGAGPVLNNLYFLEEASDEALFATINTGRPGTSMPAWGQISGGIFTDEDIQDIVNFVRKWEETASFVEEDIFEPNASRGASIYLSTCFICHEGATAVRLNNQEKILSRDEDWYRQTIINGRPAKGMPSWGKALSTHQVEDLMALISAWGEGQQIAPDTSVLEILMSALFALSQKDSEDAIFYLERAEKIAFGPTKQQIPLIILQINNNSLDEAYASLIEEKDLWPIGDAERGVEVYSATCLSCHGAEGEGGVGPKLTMNDFIQTSTNSSLLTFLLAGSPDTPMRGFDERLSEFQLADVIAFLRTWQTTTP